MQNAVTGVTNGGALSLQQTAIGGLGGYSNGGKAGVGGNATSNLSFDDSKSAQHSSSLSGAVYSNGGYGGDGQGGSSGAAAGAATSSLSLIGTGSVQGFVGANGGHGGGASGAGLIGKGGNASATVTLTAATSVVANATATGGFGGTAGAASASATGSGTSGSFSATASTAAAGAHLVESVSSNTSGSVMGTANGEALASIGATASSFTTSFDGIGAISGSPSHASVSSVLGANPHISAAFGASPSIFGIAELGGSHSSGGNSTSQTITSSVNETVDLTQLASRKDLMVGLYHGMTVGSGFTGLTFDLYADGMDLIHQTFSSQSAAVAYFTDHPLDLGSLASGSALGANTLMLRAVLQVTTSGTNSGFYAAMLIGDPPPLEQSAAYVGGRAEEAAPMFADHLEQQYDHTIWQHPTPYSHMGPDWV